MVEYDTSYPKKETTDEVYNVWINWREENMPWNEICAKVVEVFGLPGIRYKWHPSLDTMCFSFKSEKDFVLCEILLSEYITR